MRVHQCVQCGLLFNGKARVRTYCSNECRSAAKEQRRKEQLAEFHWIRGTDSWDNVATRLGFGSRDSLARFLQRCGEQRWANEVERNGAPSREDRQWLAA